MRLGLMGSCGPLASVLAGLVLTLATGPVAAVACQDREGDETDQMVQAELAKLDALVQGGKLARAITEVRKLYKSTGSLRAGFALLKLHQSRAEELGKANRRKAHLVLVEAGELARELLDNPAFPADARGGLIHAVWQQACSEAFTGKEEEALRSLSDLFGYGFEDFSRVEGDPDFARLARNESFQKLVTEARQAVVEKELRQARQEIAAFESFDFDFNTTDLAGQPLSLAGLKGRIVVVDFWGTWCPPCRAGIPSFIRLKDRYSGDVEIVGLAYERGEPEEAPAKVIKFGTENGINYPCAIGAEETRQAVPGFRGYPTTLFIDRTGKVRMVTVGAEPYERLEALVQALMEEDRTETSDSTGNGG